MTRLGAPARPLAPSGHTCEQQARTQHPSPACKGTAHGPSRTGPGHAQCLPWEHCPGAGSSQVSRVLAAGQEPDAEVLKNDSRVLSRPSARGIGSPCSHVTIGIPGDISWATHTPLPHTAWSRVFPKRRHGNGRSRPGSRDVHCRGQGGDALHPGLLLRPCSPDLQDRSMENGAFNC